MADAHQQAADQPGQPAGPVDDHHRRAGEGRFQRGGAAGDDGGVGGGEDVGGAAVDQGDVFDVGLFKLRLVDGGRDGNHQLQVGAGRFQGAVNLGDGRHARLVLTLFDAIEGFRADAGAAGQLDLRQPQLAASAEDGAGLEDGQRCQGRIVAVRVRRGQVRRPHVRLAQERFVGRFVQHHHAFSFDQHAPRGSGALVLFSGFSLHRTRSDAQSCPQ